MIRIISVLIGVISIFIFESIILGVFISLISDVSIEQIFKIDINYIQWIYIIFIYKLLRYDSFNMVNILLSILKHNNEQKKIIKYE